MATGQEWGQALQGMGAWFAGKGPEYEAVQVANARTAQEDAIRTDERRRKAMIQDITLTKSLADSGQWDKASELLQNRLMEIDRLGGDPKHTLALYESISDPARRPEAVSEMNAFIQAGIMAGEIKALPGAEEAYSSIFTTDDGRRAGLNKATGKVEILPSEDGIRARMPEGASGDAQKGSTQVVIIGGKPYLSGSVFNPQTQQWSNQIIPMEDPTGAGGSVEIADSSGLGASERAEQLRRQEEAKAQGSGAGARGQEVINYGYDAGRGIPVLRRAAELLNLVKTGGPSQWRLAAQQWFGIEAADPAELSNNLGKAVLAQLRSTFGAAFTAKEGDFLKEIEAGFGRSNEGNLRLIEQAIKRSEKYIDIAQARALEAGDRATYEELEQLRTWVPRPDGDQTTGGQRQPTGQAQPGGFKVLGVK